MMWEYTYLKYGLDVTSDDVKSKLNELGNEGWEVFNWPGSIIWLKRKAAVRASSDQRKSNVQS
jgi:hypothetical protein